MITYLRGDATDPQGDGPKVIVHCCNDVGAWGAGFTRALDARWDSPREVYGSFFWTATVENPPLGYVMWAEIEPDLQVAGIVGQHGLIGDLNLHPVKYDALYTGLDKINRTTSRETTLHMPRMGAGLAGGDWRVIEAIINETCTRDVYVYDLPVP